MNASSMDFSLHSLEARFEMQYVQDLQMDDGGGGGGGGGGGAMSMVINSRVGSASV